MLVRSRTFLALLFFFHSSFLFSSNFHEHLFSLPFPEHIAKEHQAIFSLPESEQRLSVFFSTLDALQKKLTLQWSKKEVRGITLGTTLRTLCHTLPGDPQQNLCKLLTYTTAKKSPRAVRKFDYETAEDLRKNLFLALPLDPFLRIYEAYFAAEPLINREVISATVTRRFFLPKQRKKYSALMHLARSYQSRLIYRVSLQRNTLLKKGIALPENVLALLRSQKLGGIDVAGSLFEETFTYPYSQKKIEQKLKTLFDFIHKNRLVLVLHLFEERNDDPFYTALKNALVSWDKPLFLEVGHIAALTKEWIQLFATNSALHTLFHVNPQSNNILHDTSPSTLQKIVKRLAKKGLPVALGSDGRGILPASSYQEQKALFPSRLSHFTFLSIREEFSSTKLYYTKKWTESPETVY